MTRNEHGAKHYAYDGIRKNEDGWHDTWCEVEILQTVGSTMQVMRDDGMCAWVASHKIWQGERRIDGPGWTRVDWYDATEVDIEVHTHA